MSIDYDAIRADLEEALRLVTKAEEAYDAVDGPDPLSDRRLADRAGRLMVVREFLDKAIEEVVVPDTSPEDTTHAARVEALATRAREALANKEGGKAVVAALKALKAAREGGAS